MSLYSSHRAQSHGVKGTVQQGNNTQIIKRGRHYNKNIKNHTDKKISRYEKTLVVFFYKNKGLYMVDSIWIQGFAIVGRGCIFRFRDIQETKCCPERQRKTSTNFH